MIFSGYFCPESHLISDPAAFVLTGLLPVTVVFQPSWDTKRLLLDVKPTCRADATTSTQTNRVTHSNCLCQHTDFMHQQLSVRRTNPANFHLKMLIWFHRETELLCVFSQWDAEVRGCLEGPWLPVTAATGPFQCDVNVCQRRWELILAHTQVSCVCTTIRKSQISS